MAQNAPPNSGYRVKIKQFEGPLDLLLYLIEKAELDIRDVFVAEITSEFLSYLAQLDELDMDQASEFVSVAATLVYMKSRSLMPLTKPDDANVEEDPAEQLMRRLREYKVFKEASQAMRQLFSDASSIRYRSPMEFHLPPNEIILKDPSIEGLYHAFLSALHRLPSEIAAEPLHDVHADRFTIRSCAHSIRQELLLRGGSLLFTDFAEGRRKLEIIVTFMALLEMLLRG